jgi:hypothetical protein
MFIQEELVLIVIKFWVIQDFNKEKKSGGT